MSTDDIQDFTTWLIDHGLNGTPIKQFLPALADRLNGHGANLKRINLGSDVLHPTVDSRSFHWTREKGVEMTMLDRGAFDEDGPDWQQSPFRHMLVNQEKSLRRKLGPDAPSGEFPLLDRFASEGATEYAAFAVGYGDGSTLAAMDGMISSWLTDAPGGFGNAQMTMIESIQKPLALVFNRNILHATTRTLLGTYLGEDAAKRVLGGNIERGRAETIRAVIWFSDLSGFTRVADTMDRHLLLGLLNDYAGIVVDTLEAHGGNVLKFMGDGMLAIFPAEQMENACGHALKAAREAIDAAAALSATRSADGLPTTDLYLALHEGELLYGNFGGRSRLDFTVLGPAVNEASRMAALSRSIDQRIIVSSAFADTCGAKRDHLVSLGRYALRGVARPQELFTLEPEAYKMA
jgi:adenylate cyclase